MTAYTDATKIAAYLGVTLTAGQQTQAGVLAQAASDWIDSYVGQSWQDDGSVSDEVHGPIGDRVYLNHRPVSAVSTVKTRGTGAGDSPSVLDSDQYELLDEAHGVLLIAGWQTGGLVLISYTHAATTPPTPVGLAATMIAASWLAPTVSPQTAGLSSVAVGQNDVAVKFRDDRGDVPAEAIRLLAPYRRFVVA